MNAFPSASVLSSPSLGQNLMEPPRCNQGIRAVALAPQLVEQAGRAGVASFPGPDKDSSPPMVDELKHALALVAASRSLLIRSKDESRLLDAVCERAVQPGRYVCACIVRVAAGPVCALQVVATRGRPHHAAMADGKCADAGTLHSARIALQEARCVVLCPATSGGVHPAARSPERHFASHSTLALPIRVLDRDWGVLVLCSALAHAISAAEVGLLSELAEDIGWHLGALRDQAELTAEARALRHDNATLRAQLREHAAALATRNRELDAIRYSFAHDLRAPLRSIDGFALILNTQHAAQLDDTARSRLERMRRAAQRMGRLIDRTLDLLHLASHRMRRQELNLSKLAAEIFCKLARTEPERRIQVHVAPQLFVQADAKLLHTLLEHLFESAWERTRSVTDAAIEFGAARDSSGQGYYFVRDNGIDFDPAQRAPLNGSSPRSAAKRGPLQAGGSLAAVAAMIERSGGSIWERSSMTEGTTACFSFEAEKEGAKRSADPTDPTMRGETGKT